MSKLRTILLAKQIRDKEAELEALRARDAEFQTREADLAEAIESAETDEERSAVEESVTALETEQNEASEQRGRLEGELAELRTQLTEAEAAQAEAMNNNNREERSAAPAGASRQRGENHMNHMELRDAEAFQKSGRHTYTDIRSLLRAAVTTGSDGVVGPTGVGKTELAKALAQALFDDERNMVRIDMTEYMEKFSVSRLIGAPPGYVGYEEGGQLTEAVRRKPYSVVLFDEVEKAHPDVFNILLQVLDDGRITDSQGRTVDFKNTVIILTSNLGSDIILNDLEQRRAQGSNELSEDARKQIDLLLKSKFRPEFLNRLDEIVYYKSLTKDETRKIVDLQLEDLRKRMDEGKHLKLDVTTAAKDFIIDSSYDSVYGARPIKRFIQSRVETLIAKAIIQGSYAEGNTLTVDCENGTLVLR